MQFEMACPTCPLCKRQLPASAVGFNLDTRLCQPCQALVLTAFRGVDSTALSTFAVIPQNGGVAEVEHDSPAFDYVFAGSPSFSARISAGLEPEAEHLRTFDAPDELSFGFFEAEELSHRFDAEVDDSSGRADADSVQIGEMSSAEVIQPIVAAEPCVDREYAEPVATDMPYEAASTVSMAESQSIEARVVGDLEEDALSSEEQAVTDPWAAPLPAWEYSQNEWPVFAGSSTRSSLVTPRRAFAATMIMLAVVAGFYLLFLSISSPPRRADAKTVTTERESAAAEPHGSVLKAEHNDALGGALSSTAAPGSSPRPADTVLREEASSNEDNNGRGRFSLQAAAFPTQSGADEFAEKLKRAGVPSYVAAADLARRGRWFRVRVGRFSAAEDAQKFAGEAQQRARAAGLSLQLIVCQYDQP